MKTLSLFLGLMFLAISQMSAQTTGSSVTTPSVVVKRWIGPYPTKQSDINTLVAMLQSNATSALGWTYIPDGGNVCLSNVLNSSSGNGNALYYTLSIDTGTIDTSLDKVITTLTAKLYSWTGSIPSYTMRGVGIAADGTQYWSGNASTPVRKIYAVGGGSTFDILPGSTVAQTLTSWAGVCPLEESFTCELSSSQAVSGVTYTVPGPTIITNVLKTGSTIVLQGTSGIPGGKFVVLSSTNLNISRSSWKQIATNSVDGSTNYFDGNGNFNVTVTTPANVKSQYYSIELSP